MKKLPGLPNPSCLLYEKLLKEFPIARTQLARLIAKKSFTERALDAALALALLMYMTLATGFVIGVWSHQDSQKDVDANIAVSSSFHSACHSSVTRRCFVTRLHRFSSKQVSRLSSSASSRFQS